MTHHRQRILMLLLVATVGFAPAVSAVTYHYTGDITSGAQFDVYPILFEQGTIIHADSRCTTPFTLDTILTVFAPGVDPSNTANALYYNDDGGDTVCGGFRSSHIDGYIPETGIYNLRVDGFGSATGPYTLDVSLSFVAQAIPTLDGVGLSLLIVLLAGISLVILRRRRHA